MINFQRHSVKVLLASVCVMAVFVLGFFSTFSTLYFRWIKWDEAYGHGFLVIAITAYLLVRSMEKVWQMDLRPWKSGITILLCISILWFIASTAGITIIQQLLLPFALWVFILVVLGLRAGWVLLFPIAFLYFAIPIWDYLNDVLIGMTVFVVKVVLQAMEIPAFVEGSSIQLPSGRIYVADGCSGLRYVISGCALASLSAYLNFYQARDRLFVICLGLVLSILANWIRVFSLILIGFYSQMESSLMKDHNNFGWLVFFATFSPVFLLSWFLGKPTLSEGNVKKHDVFCADGMQSKLLISLAALAVLMVGPVLSALSVAGGEPEFRLVFQTPESWERKPLTIGVWIPDLPKPYRQINAVFEQEGEALTVNIFAYKTDTNTRKLLPYIASVYDRDSWHVEESKVVDIQTQTSLVSTNMMNLKRSTGTEMEAVWYWYGVGGMITPHYFMAKVAQVPAKLFQKDYAMVVVLSRSCQQGCQDDHDLIRHFLTSADFSSYNLVVKAEGVPGISSPLEPSNAIFHNSSTIQEGQNDTF